MKKFDGYYISESGKRFSDKDLCVRYEERYKKVKALEEKYLVSIPENKVDYERFKSGLLYLQHDEYNFFRFKTKLLDLITDAFAETNLYFMKNPNLIEDEIMRFLMDINRQEYDSRNEAIEFLKSSIDGEEYEPLLESWDRVMCTDLIGKEWGFRFYLHHPKVRDESGALPYNR